jgi:hypothetical protein
MPIFFGFLAYFSVFLNAGGKGISEAGFTNFS